MYRTTPLFDYIKEGEYAIMPPGLPDRFYPEDPEKVYKTDDYVICFNIDVGDDLKRKLIKDYAEYYAKEKASGLYH